MRKFLSVSALALVAIHAAAATSSAQNLLVDPSFENPVTRDGAPFIGLWEAFSGDGTAMSNNSTNTPRTGAQSLEMSINGTNNSFAGAFQDVGGLTPGALTTFSGFHMTPSTPNGVASEYRIEWRNSATLNVEISRNQLTVGPAGAQYTPFEVSGVVPAGADTARLVYAIQTFGGEPAPGDIGTVRIDDLSFVVVPEPTTVAALAAAGLLLGRKRR